MRATEALSRSPRRGPGSGRPSSRAPRSIRGTRSASRSTGASPRHGTPRSTARSTRRSRRSQSGRRPSGSAASSVADHPARPERRRSASPLRSFVPRAGNRDRPLGKLVVALPFAATRRKVQTNADGCRKSGSGADERGLYRLSASSGCRNGRAAPRTRAVAPVGRRGQICESELPWRSPPRSLPRRWTVHGWSQPVATVRLVGSEFGYPGVIVTTAGLRLEGLRLTPVVDSRLVRLFTLLTRAGTTLPIDCQMWCRRRDLNPDEVALNGV